MAGLCHHLELVQPGRLESSPLLAPLSPDQRWREARPLQGLRLLLLQQLLLFSIHP